MLGMGVATSQSEPSATDAPVDTLAELRELQERVREVSAANSAATVGIVIPETASSGSGVIVDQNGMVLTAAHVVDGAEEVTIIFTTGDVARAEVLGLDRMRDQAMLRLIGEREWPYVEIDREDGLEIGEWVVALGHPGGYDPVRTPPVRLGRKLSDNASDFITTDSKLIGGDSGGPLFDLEGKLVGIHSSIGRTGSVNNHASIEGFIQTWDDLLSGQRTGSYGELSIGHPDGAFLGISFDPRRRRDGGVLVSEVLPDGPAALAGLRPGDLLVKIDDFEIGVATDLALAMGRHRSGERISVTIVRGQRALEVPVELASRSEVLGQ